jgi:hypothetical protein
VLFGGLAVAALLKAAGAPLARPAAVSVVTVAAVSLLFFGGIWDAADALRAATRTNRAIPRAAAEVAGGAATNVGFLAWARTKMTHGDAAPSYWLTPDAVRADALIYQWSTYQLLPAWHTERVQQAHWIVLYGGKPREIRHDHAAFRRVSIYAPGFALAERLDG